MRKICVTVIAGFIVFSAFGAGENVPTSKSYIDSVLVDKQDTIERTTGASRALTNTGTAGEYGTKDIYDSTSSYAEQTDALIDAQTMNTAVQNAINAEFVCISWVDDDPTKDCLLMEIRGVTATGATTLPSGYTALEYIESTGTQYIDTGIAPTNTTGLAVKFNKSTTGDQVVVGTDVGDARGRLYVNPAGNMFLPFAEAWRDAHVGSTILNTDYDIQINYNNDRKRYVNGISVLDITQILRGPSATMFMFAGRAGGGGPSWYFQGKIYYLKITEGLRTVRNFVPARRDSDNEIGMYDTVTNTFFTNAGTGEFIAGPVVNLYLPAGN